MYVSKSVCSRRMFVDPNGALSPAVAALTLDSRRCSRLFRSAIGLNLLPGCWVIAAMLPALYCCSGRWSLWTCPLHVHHVCAHMDMCPWMYMHGHVSTHATSDLHQTAIVRRQPLQPKYPHQILHEYTLTTFRTLICFDHGNLTFAQARMIS